MATRLKNLRITKVDFVDKGANPDAHILLFKRDNSDEKKYKTENGVKYPAEAYAYVPDPDKPSTWKLRLWEDPEKKETRAQVARAIMAISPSGFRGNRAKIPAEDMPKVKVKIREAWKKVHPDASEEDMPDILKKGGARGMSLADLGKAIAEAIVRALKQVPEDEIEEETSRFAEEKMKARIRRFFDENWWDNIYALREALEKIIADNTIDEAEKEAMIDESLNEFAEAIKGAIANPAMAAAFDEVEKAGRKIAAERLQRIKQMRDMLDALIAEVEDVADTDSDEGITDTNKEQNNKKGVDEEMKIDKSKMTPEDRALLEELEKKYGIVDDPQDDSQDIQKKTDSQDGQKKADDVYKGLHPEVAKELEELRKFKEAAEFEKMVNVAKKYEILGKKPEELAKKLIELKKAGGTTYDDYIALLDEQLDLIEKTGLFREIGKRGIDVEDPWVAIEKRADEILKSNPNLTRAQAIDKACELYPELVEAYEKSKK